jgi:hypothetical protein
MAIEMIIKRKKAIQDPTDLIKYLDNKNKKLLVHNLSRKSNRMFYIICLVIAVIVGLIFYNKM